MKKKHLAILTPVREDGTVPTVAVIVTDNDTLQSYHSFPDNDKGNREAEKLFKAIVKKLHPKIKKDEIEIHIEDGFFSTYTEQVYLSHC